MRGADRATLATRMRDGDGAPYASLVLIATAHDATPILLISELAEHTQNLHDDARVSLLFDGTAGLDDPLTGPRVTIQGQVRKSDDVWLRARFLARHPSAANYADFGDFGFYTVAVERAHLIAGFGRIDWISAGDLLFDAATDGVLASHEADIVANMNADHRDALDLYAKNLLRRGGAGWKMSGLDPEGIDLNNGNEIVRLEFEAPVRTAEAARAALVEFARRARQEVAAKN